MKRPSSCLVALNAGNPSRFPAGTAVPKASSRAHFAFGPAWGGLAPVRRNATESAAH